MVTIKACYIDDERQYMEFKAQLTANNQIDENEKIFGVAVEWEKEKSNYTKWPFIVSPDDGHWAFVEWEGSDQVTMIDLMGRNVVVGATFTRIDGMQGKSNYKIKSIAVA
ncbi:hypothetical protein HOP54_03150 [Halomonas daqingensis]|uniref:hypothetical protein n=1 Tax=Billgrantia desiderata TaxID=52021 RepID=UPI00089F6F5F|nr:hypothetical protein [Halomonas desiderata]MCE8027685.1 hypothetical protein [Halomonas desiderata]NIC39423.1 hypothetical protein [Halomonas desiderata]SEG18051.1 hypothetical protein SAMN04487953_11674 [Halomonas desiderata]